MIWYGAMMQVKSTVFILVSYELTPILSRQIENSQSVRQKMNPLDEFDIREAFDAMDKEKLGLISMDEFYTLYLGLGFPKCSLEVLRSEVAAVHSDTSKLTVGTALSVASRVSDLPIAVSDPVHTSSQYF